MRNEGNVLLLILVGIVLFGALTFAITQSEDNSDTNIDYERSVLSASALLNYSTDLKRALSRMSELNRCTPEQMSFEQHPYTDSSVFTGFPNPNSPSDFSCHVFHPNGGNITPPGGSSDFGAVRIQVTGECDVWGVGRHILLGVAFEDVGGSEDLCRNINKAIGHNAPSFDPTDHAFGCATLNFVGDFPHSAGGQIRPDSSQGVHRSCSRGAFSYNGSIGTGNTHFWYHEIIHYRD